MKLVLMGTNDFVVPMFERLAAGHDILAVYTAAPSPKGRKHVLTPSPVDVWASGRAIPVHYDPSVFNYTPDYTVVVSYGEILRSNVLNAAPCINIHPSDLPKYRGPSPIRTAIYNGDRQSAVCLIDVTSQLDAGDIHMRHEMVIGENETNADIEAKVSQIGAAMLDEYLNAPENYPGIAQVGTPTFTHKFTGQDQIIHWDRGAQAIHNQIRALGAGRTKIDGIDVKILETRLSGGNLEIVRIQPAGGRPMDWASFVNGHPNASLKIGE